MSATLDEDLFSRYFNTCPVISVPGRTFPVQLRHIEETDALVRRYSSGALHAEHKEQGESSPVVPISPLACDAEYIARLIYSIINKFSSTDSENIESSGNAILVFLPGLQTIKKIDYELKSMLRELKLPVSDSLQVFPETKCMTSNSVYLISIRKSRYLICIHET